MTKQQRRRLTLIVTVSIVAPILGWSATSSNTSSASENVYENPNTLSVSDMTTEQYRSLRYVPPVATTTTAQLTTTTQPTTTTTQPTTTTTEHEHSPSTTVTPQPTPVSTTVANGSCGGWRSLVSAYFPSEVAKACAVLMCESRGDPTAYNPYSTASGLWQFLDATWEQTTGTPAPASAYSAKTQTAAASSLRNSSGWSAWECS